ncbi:MAG: M24 family metallopeptidase [Candidatus Poseidoniales archaeon]|jgi:Xaa-Pro aminopeptidase|tara:strand:- start:2835 stop:4091 length:1257 start_codon:yes stop_codon:yes gene_type:complete
MTWDIGRLTGPDGVDWRVPVSELENRRMRLAEALLENGIESALIDDPVELYWLTGGRQNGMILVGAKDSDVQTTHWVKRSLERAIFESGGDDCPNPVISQPRMAELAESIRKKGGVSKPSLLEGKIPHDRWKFISEKIGGLDGTSKDCTSILYHLREKKSEWEIQMLRDSGDINKSMFEAIREKGGLGKTELEMAAIADEVSRTAGFGGRIRMRKWPMDCDRVVIVAGSSASIPSYFDSAIGGIGASPISSLGSGHAKVQRNSPVTVDIVHLHRGYVSDCTRMFSAGILDDHWLERLEHMVEIRNAVVDSLGKGDECSRTWEIGSLMAKEMGYSENLMGMSPDKSNFLGHSVGLELDETPVIAKGFDRPLCIGGTMAIEPKVIFPDGCMGTEDTFVRTKDGMEYLTMGDSFPLITDWI